LLKDITGNYTASFVVSGGFVVLATLTMSTLPHYFSCKEPRRRSPDNKDKGSPPELEQMHSSPPATEELMKHPVSPENV